MNQMAEAIIRSGVQTTISKTKTKTLMERVWRMVNDHPNSTSLRISSLLNLPRGTVSACLSDMERRKMVTAAFTKMLIKNSKGGGFANRNIKQYKTNTYQYTVLGNYVKSKKYTKSSKPTVKSAQPVETVRVVQPELKFVDKFETPVVINKQDKFINSLTIAEGRSLYEKLKVIYS